MPRCLICESTNLLIVDESKIKGKIIHFSEKRHSLDLQGPSYMCCDCNFSWKGTRNQIISQLKELEGELFEDHKPEEALKINELLFMLNSEDNVALHNMGACYLMMGDEGKALGMFMQATEVNEECSVSYYMAGLIFKNKNELSTAAKCFDLAITSEEVQDDEELLNAAKQQKEEVMKRMLPGITKTPYDKQLYQLVDYYFNRKQKVK